MKSSKETPARRKAFATQGGRQIALVGLLLSGAVTAQGQFAARSAIAVNGVGVVPTESDYVPNVVQAENGLASFEALKAQAVAARTFAYYKMNTAGSINDGTSDQVYTGNGQPPRQIHLDAAAATEGEILWIRDTVGVQQDVLIAAFYVAGAIPTGPFDPDNPGVIHDVGDSDPTSTEKWVTYTYAGGDYGGNNLGTPLGFQGSPSNPNWPNRGAHSQNGADYLSDNSVNYLDILKYYYGADIQVRTATTQGTSVEYGRKILATFDDYGSGRASDGTIDGNEGVFHRSPTYSGSTSASLAGSDAVRDDSTARDGSHSQRIDIVYDETSGEDFFLRHVAGAKYSDYDGSLHAAERVANVQFESIGTVGLWLKTSDPGLEVSIALDDPVTGDRGVKRSVIADGEWHEYKWSLDVDAQWESWAAGGNGAIDGVNVSLDSIQLFGATDATVYMDSVFWDPSEVFAGKAAGDFNSDGVVDAADYTVWKDNYLAFGENPADANGDNVVTNADYDIWAENYGLSVGVAALAVPEPSAVGVALIAVLRGIATPTRRRR